MLSHRKIGDVELYQIIELMGPTHAREVMLPGLPLALMQDNVRMLEPDSWLSATDQLVFAIKIFILKVGGRTILIDTGIGNHKPRTAGWQDRLNTRTAEWLAGCGAGPDQVDHVVHTHLHVDHVGWNTVREGDRWVPFFKNATYHYPRVEWDAFKAQYDGGDHGMWGGSFADSVLPVWQAGLVRFIEDGAKEVAGCLSADLAIGHSPGHMTLTLNADDETLIFSGDIIHSAAQVLMPQVNSQWCVFPDEARATRRRLLARAATTGATLYPAHSRGVNGWIIGKSNDGYVVDDRG